MEKSVNAPPPTPSGARARYGGRLALRGELAFGELASVVLVAQNAFDGARFARAAAANVSAQALGPLAQMASLLAQRPRIGPPHAVRPSARRRSVVRSWSLPATAWPMAAQSPLVAGPAGADLWGQLDRAPYRLWKILSAPDGLRKRGMP